MILYKDSFSVYNLNAYQRSFLTENMIFTDIETTGFSPTSCRIYCIGCGWLEKDTIQIALYFTEKKEDEKQILSAFADLTKKFTKIVTFNGNTFDLPFLKKRMAHHAISYSLENLISMDILSDIRPYRNLLQLPDYRQKTLEQFLCCDREDKYNGGELIQIYLDYESSHSEGQRELLILHNLEDVKGMFQLLDLYTYCDFINGKYRIQNIHVENTAFKSPDCTNQMISICLQFPFEIPQAIRQVSESHILYLRGYKGLIQFPIYSGTLRHYFPNYKDYYFLPDENTIVHKSIGEFVDKNHREKATKANCFLSAECYYLKGNAKIKNSYLRQNETDPFLYLKIDPSILFQNTIDRSTQANTYNSILDFIKKFNFCVPTCT